MLDSDFFTALEYEIGNLFDNFPIDDTHGFWCDGVCKSESELYYSKKYVNDHREVKLKAFIGKDGQDVYVLTLKFGQKALSKFARGLRLEETIPTGEDFLLIDVLKKEVTVQLD